MLRAAALTAALAATAAAQEPPPRFRAGVEVTAIDVAVVDGAGQPITDLAAGDFVVRIDGTPRRIVSAEWISSSMARSTSAAPVPDGFSSNESVGGGRLIVLAVDETTLPFGSGRGVLAAASRFLETLPAGDRVAVVGIGRGGRALGFTTNRRAVRDAVAGITGRGYVQPHTQYHLSLMEAAEIDKGNSMAAGSATNRECEGLSGKQREICVEEVIEDARTILSARREQSRDFVIGLRQVLVGLKSIDAPKTLVLISNGFIPDDATSDATEIANAAAAARTSLYALQLDRSFVDISDTRPAVDPYGDQQERLRGLEALAAMARGTLFVVTGTGDAIFRRIASELAGYYLIGVESDPRDRDGRPHQIKVDVNRRGAAVRARRQFIADTNAGILDPQQALVAALTNPLPLPGLSIRAIAFALRGPERDKVQLLIHAEIGGAYAAPTPVLAGFTLTDAEGRVVDTRLARGTLNTAVPGAPSALVYVTGAAVAPGDYVLKVAAADQERVGSVEHPVHAVFSGDTDPRLSDLVTGSPQAGRPETRPPVSSTAWYGAMQGYLESYGAGSNRVSVRYEVAVDDEQPALASVASGVRHADEDRSVHTAVVPVAMLPPGVYRLRARVTLPDGSRRTLSRAFTVPRSVPALSSSGEPIARDTSARVNLSVSPASLRPAFDLAAVLAPSAVGVLLDGWLPQSPRPAETSRYLDAARAGALATLPPEPGEGDAAGWFVRGLAFLQRRDYAAAEANLKKAISDETDATVPLVYLAATYAAAGLDQPAAAAWVTALGGSDDVPEVFEWAAGALMRAHEVARARDLLEEASARWPDDARFARPLALLYATFGRGHDAIAQLERHLAASPGDEEALLLGVRWYYELHLAGASAHDDDLARATRYAEAYEALGGPDMPLVRQWLEFVARHPAGGS